MKIEHYRAMSAGDYVKQEVLRQCEHPVTRKVYDYEKKQFVNKAFPCKKCLTCLRLQQSQWVERFKNESLTYKHVYFGTLTISSEFLTHNKKYREYTAAFKKKGQWTPLLLNRKIITLFWQRLRNNTEKDFSYFFVGEYGEHTSRPHWHFILWSDQEFTTDEIAKAWSVYNKPICDTSVPELKNNLLIDLVANGTLSDIRSDSPLIAGMESKNMSKYVLKYVNKIDSKNGLLDKMKTKKEIIRYFKKNFIKTQEFATPLNRDLTHSQVESSRQHVRKIFDKNKDKINNTIETHDIKKEFFTYKTPQEFFGQFLPYTMCSKSHIIGSEYTQEYLKNESSLFKKQYDKYTGKRIRFPERQKRNFIQEMLPILPCDDFSFNTSLENIPRMPYVFSLIRGTIIDADDQRNVFDYRTNWYFRSRTRFYQVKADGYVNEYSWRTGEYKRQLTLNEFEQMCNYDNYIKFKETYDKEFNEFAQSKIDLFNEAVQIMNLTEDLDSYKKRVRRDYRLQFIKNQQEYNYRHKQF